MVLLFNESWKRGFLPKVWKNAEIVPIPKHSGATKLDKLRPISLLSVVGKLMDKLVARRLSERGEKEGWFPSWQGGFRPGRGVCDQLVAFTHTVTDAWRRRRVCITAFLDASKAYDRVHRDGLAKKLIDLGVPGRMLQVGHGLYVGAIWTCEVQRSSIEVQGVPLWTPTRFLFEPDFVQSVFQRHFCRKHCRPRYTCCRVCR